MNSSLQIYPENDRTKPDRSTAKRAVDLTERWWESSQEKMPSRNQSSCGASISTVADALTTLVSIIDEADVAELATATGRIRQVELVAEARLRYALHLKDESAPFPAEWFDGENSRLDGCLAAAKSSTGKLLGALAQVISLNAASVDLEAGPDGTVIVSFGDGIRWIVYAPRLPWPGCDVRLYAPETPTEYRLRAEHYRHVKPLIEATAFYLGTNGH